MKKLIPCLSFAAMAVAVSAPTYAETGFYAGIKTGTITVDENEIDDLKDTSVEIDDGTLGGLLFGYQFNNEVAIEVDIAGSELDLDNFPGYESIDMGLFGMYVAYRSTGQWYFKGRAGLLSRSIELNAVNPSNPLTPEDDDSESSLSIGFGGGVRVEQFSIEAEFTTVEDGVNTFSLNGLYRF